MCIPGSRISGCLARAFARNLRLGEVPRWTNAGMRTWQCQNRHRTQERTWCKRSRFHLFSLNEAEFLPRLRRKTLHLWSDRQAPLAASEKLYSTLRQSKSTVSSFRCQPHGVYSLLQPGRSSHQHMRSLSWGRSHWLRSNQHLKSLPTYRWKLFYLKQQIIYKWRQSFNYRFKNSFV